MLMQASDNFMQNISNKILFLYKKEYIFFMLHKIVYGNYCRCSWAHETVPIYSYIYIYLYFIAYFS